MAAPLPGAAPDGVRLVSSDATGVVLEVDVPTPELVPVVAKNGSFVRLAIPGWGGEAPAGHPLLPSATLLLAVPENASVSLDAGGEGERLYEGVRLLPQQELARGESGASEPAMSIIPRGPLDASVQLDRAAYAREGYGDGVVASLDGVTWLRSQRVARLTLRPAAFDPAGGRVRVWSRLRVRLSFGGGASARPPASSPLLAPPVASGEEGFEPVYRGALLNYESGRTWRRDLGAQSLRRRGLAPNARPSASGGLFGGPRQDFTASPNWVRLTVSAKGVYRVDPSDLALAGANIATLDPRTLRVFVKPGLPVLDETQPPTDWLSEIAISVVGEGDGAFDPTDYLLFVGLGVSGWKDEYGAPASFQAWLNHPYETRNTYWLTWGGGFIDPPHRWSARSGAPELPGAVEAPFYRARQHFESDFSYVPDLQEGGLFHAYRGTFWEKWAWLKINSSSPPIQLINHLPGAVESEPVRMKARLWGNSRRVTGPFGYPEHLTNVTINDVVFPERAYTGLVRQDYDTTFVGIREVGNRIVFTARPLRVDDPNSSDPRDSLLLNDEVALFWYEYEYARRFQPTANLLDFRSPESPGPVAYALAPFTATTGFLLLDTSDPLATVQVTGIVERDTTGGKAIHFHDDVTSRRHYLALTASGVRRPDGIQRVAVDDLVSPANGAHYVVVTYDGFTDPARDLASFRGTRLPNVASPRTRTVKISDIYAWYSGGRTDPTAIRNFFYDAIRQVGWSPAPTTVCFLGDASYDFKNILRVASPGLPPSLVPAYVNGYQTRQFMTDDWLVDLDLGVTEPYPGPPGPGIPDSTRYDLPDLMVGRLPASNLSEAQFLVNGKVIPYEADPTWGEWRARGLLLADDTVQGLDSRGQPAPDPLSVEHMKESEFIADALLPDEIEPRKIYMHRYPFATGAEKPAVNRDVEETVNEGVVFWNYIGHGNPFKMADENAFILSDVGSLLNIDKLTFVIAASCDISKFDDPIVTGLGEALLKSTSGGCIATFSASDIAFAFANAALARKLFAHLFTETPEGYTNPLGAVVLAAKLRQFTGSENDLKYILMGDPAQTLALPKHDVRLTLTDDETGAPLDSLRRGRRVRVRGEVHASHDPNVSALIGDYAGVSALLVTDAPPRDSVVEGNPPYTRLRYRYDPGTVFRGDVPITGGRFEAVFVMPLESIPGNGGKVR
ncbi:MAG: C25 family cysteine peptidase, partial [Candidatus Eisenbacteria bacterium]